MTLREIVTQLDTLDEDSTICLRRPWCEDSEAVLTPAPEGRVPAEVERSGFEYFLEVHVAKEVLEVFDKRAPSVDERVACLLYYAEYDAFPDWVHD